MTKSYNIATFIYCVLDNFEAVHCNFPPSRLITQFFFMCTSAYNVIFFLPTDTRQLRTGNLLDVSPVGFSVFTGKYTIHNVHMLVNIITLLDFYGFQCYSLSGFWLFVGAGFPPIQPERQTIASAYRNAVLGSLHDISSCAIKAHLETILFNILAIFISTGIATGLFCELV